jgi:hypothetical protein
MFQKRLNVILFLGGLISILAIMSVAEDSETNKSHNTQAAQEIQVRGQVVCLAEEMHTLYRSDLPTNHEHLYGFKTTDGEFYTLLRTGMSEALFVDERVRAKALIIKGRTFPKTHILEAMNLYSIHDGVVHDLYYWCVTCAIRTTAPGDCVCCQEPVELVEKRIELKLLED